MRISKKICFNCGKVGHDKTQCLLSLPSMEIGDANMEDSMSAQKEDKTFGPWMLVTNKRPNQGSITSTK